MSSSKSKEMISKEDMAKIRQLIEIIEAEPQAYDFLEPVDYIGLGLDDYPKIIKTPMDISTIKKNLKNNKYSSTQEVLNDIQLIWDNCKTYNIDGSDIYKLAVFCEKFTKKNIDKLFKQKPSIPTPNLTNVNSSATKNVRTKDKNTSSNSAQNNANNSISENNKEEKKEGDEENYEPETGGTELSVQERVLLLERVRKLSNDGLASLVRLIQKECPSSIEDLDSEKLQIKLDFLDKRTHDQINQLIDTFLKVKETNQENLGQKKTKN